MNNFFFDDLISLLSRILATYLFRIFAIALGIIIAIAIKEYGVEAVNNIVFPIIILLAVFFIIKRFRNKI